MPPSPSTPSPERGAIRTLVDDLRELPWSVEISNEFSAAETELAALEASTLRPELGVFARFMESHLRAHDDTRGDSWKSESIDWLIERLEEELSELRAARRRGNFDGIVDECADVANFAMMVATLADDAARVDASKEKIHAAN